ncbi:MAG: metallophosphoesterase [Candidatus Woesearchaeota archaeon]
MKLLTCSDIHGSLPALKRLEAVAKKEKPDFLLVAGDMTIFEQDIEQVIEKLEQMPARVLLVHGNHESEEIVAALVKRGSNISFLHKRIFESDIGDWLFTGYGGGGFALFDKSLERWGEKAAREAESNRKRLIFLSHQPPYGTRLDIVYGRHVGSKSLTNFIKLHQPALVVSGHIHECFGARQRLGKSLLVSPGPEGLLVEFKQKEG